MVHQKGPPTRFPPSFWPQFIPLTKSWKMIRNFWVTLPVCNEQLTLVMITISTLSSTTLTVVTTTITFSSPL